jgi:HPr kinase/phosphorylase
MEIRGLGIIDVKALFGVGAVRASTRIRLVIELVELSDASEVDRLGLDEEFYSLLGEELPYRKVPVSPGRNAATIIEVAARNLLLKQMGQNTAAELIARLDRARVANREEIA